jgi:hypothetical protein
MRIQALQEPRRENLCMWRKYGVEWLCEGFKNNGSVTARCGFLRRPRRKEVLSVEFAPWHT